MAKKPASSPGPAPEGELVQAIDRLTDILSTVYDLLARFKDDLTWIINNREELSVHRPASATSAPVLACTQPEPIKKPEIIACSDCEVPSPASLAAALLEGWTELTPHEGERWNYVGLCPDCLESVYQLPRPTPLQADQEQIADPIDGPEQPQSTLFD